MTAGPTRIDRPEQAIARFREAWTRDVVPNVRIEESGPTHAIDSAMQADPTKLRAQFIAECPKAGTIVAQASFGSGHDFVIYGTLAALDRDGGCWEVTYEGGMKLEVAGYLDPQSGALLMVWRIPEG
jgi:hypothetical protein